MLNRSGRILAGKEAKAEAITLTVTRHARLPWDTGWNENNLASEKALLKA